jgi:hypothetical protein
MLRTGVVPWAHVQLDYGLALLSYKDVDALSGTRSRRAEEMRSLTRGEAEASRLRARLERARPGQKREAECARGAPTRPPP